MIALMLDVDYGRTIFFNDFSIRTDSMGFHPSHTHNWSLGARLTADDRCNWYTCLSHPNCFMAEHRIDPRTAKL